MIQNEYAEIAISEFYDDAPEAELVQDAGIVVLTQKEKDLYDQFKQILTEKDPERSKIIDERMKDLTFLAKAVEKFPSLLERHDLPGGIRTPQLLIDSLIKHQSKDDSTLQLPSKAILGKGYMVSKIHTFSSIAKICERVGAPAKLCQEFHTETITMMFSLLAEDVYMDLINDTNQPMEFRRSWCTALLLLWDHRNDQTVESVAPVLQQVWAARRRLAPAFGTMMGTSELITMSMQLDEQWISFIKTKLPVPEITQAMEEFLFGISTEQIATLRRILREKGISAINRDEVASFLGEHVKADAGLDYRDFYSLYAVRRDNARARDRMKLDGPKRTLEDYFITYITERNADTQNKDAFAR